MISIPCFTDGDDLSAVWQSVNEVHIIQKIIKLCFDQLTGCLDLVFIATHLFLQGV